MKKFLRDITLFALFAFAVLEVGSRLVLDPLYFYKADTYDVKSATGFGMYNAEPTKNVDFLFVGTSRVPATINPKLFSKLSGTDAVVVGGRGKMTPGIHLQAIENRLKNYPEYLKGATVFLEYPGSSVYTTPYKYDRMWVSEAVVKTDRSVPHLIVPHLDNSSLMDYVKNSHNSYRTRADVVGLYSFSAYRNSFFVNDIYHQFDRPLFPTKKAALANEGGIRNDVIEKAQQKAIEVAEKNKKLMAAAPLLSTKDLARSTINKLHEIVTSNGGKLVLYRMPLHSLQQEMHKSDKSIRNKETFDKWLAKKNITVLGLSDFKTEDSDFPDTWHLSINRRQEFTTHLYLEYAEMSGSLQFMLNSNEQ